MTLFKPPIGSTSITNATTLGGKTESQLSVANSALLNNKSEDNLNVAVATYASNSNTFASHAVDYFTLSTGTSSDTFQVGNATSGPLLKNSSGALLVRDPTDSAAADLTASAINGGIITGTILKAPSYEGNSVDGNTIDLISSHEGTTTSEFSVVTNALTSNNFGRTTLLVSSNDLSYNTYQLYDFISAKDSTAYQSLSSPSGNVTITSNPTVKAQITVNNDGNDNIVWHAGNDGSGSTLDADLLDGNEGSYFATIGGTPSTSFKIDKGASDEVTLTTGRFSGNRLLLKSNSQVLSTSTADTGAAYLMSSGTESSVAAESSGTYNLATLYSSSDLIYMQLAYGDLYSYTNTAMIDIANTKTYIELIAPNSHSIVLNSPSGSASTIKVDNNLVWHAGNDGSGSGLDADLLDGNDSSYFASAEYAVKYYGSLASAPATYKPGDEYYDTSLPALRKYISYDVGWKTVNTT